MKLKWLFGTRRPKDARIQAVPRTLDSYLAPIRFAEANERLVEAANHRAVQPLQRKKPLARTMGGGGVFSRSSNAPEPRAAFRRVSAIEQNGFLMARNVKKARFGAERGHFKGLFGSFSRRFVWLLRDISRKSPCSLSSLKSLERETREPMRHAVPVESFNRKRPPLASLNRMPCFFKGLRPFPLRSWRCGSRFLGSEVNAKCYFFEPRTDATTNGARTTRPNKQLLIVGFRPSRSEKQSGDRTSRTTITLAIMYGSDYEHSKPVNVAAPDFDFSLEAARARTKLAQLSEL